MNNKSKIENIFNLLSLILPAVLILVSTFFSPYGYSNLEKTWTKFWQYALFFYVIAFFWLLFSFFKKNRQVKGKSLKSTFQIWLVGFVLSIFSSIIARVLWDLAFFINYLITIRT